MILSPSGDIIIIGGEEVADTNILENPSSSTSSYEIIIVERTTGMVGTMSFAARVVTIEKKEY
jgi:hypothetical protein